MGDFRIALVYSVEGILAPIEISSDIFVNPFRSEYRFRL